MRYTVGIRGYGYFDWSGFGGSGRDAVAEAHTLDEMKWRDVSDEPIQRFGQLDALSKCAMVAVEMIGIRACLDARIRDGMAISIGTQEGALGTDIDLAQGIDGKKTTSPRLFVYTLPSTVCGDIAIRHGLHGPNACYQAGKDSGLVALREGYYLVRSGEAEACLCMSCDALFPSSLETARAKSLLDGDGAPSAYAFVIARREEAPRQESTTAEGISSLSILRDFLVRDAEEKFAWATLDDRNGELMYLHRNDVVSSVQETRHEYGRTYSKT